MTKDQNLTIDDSEIKETGTEISQSENLTINEVVRRVGLHRQTVINLVRQGGFPHAFFIERGRTIRWLIPSADLTDFAPRQKGAPRYPEPTKRTIDARAVRARRAVKNSHGYGQPEITEMINLYGKGTPVSKIADRFQLAEKIVADLLDHAALKPPRHPKPGAVKKALKRVPEKILIELYVTDRLPTGEILEKLEINIAALYINLRHYGIPLRDARHRRQSAEREAAIRRLSTEELLSPAAIAERLKLTPAYVKRKINEMKLERSSNSNGE